LVGAVQVAFKVIQRQQKEYVVIIKFRLNMIYFSDLFVF